ncbi:MAG: hypothetical protein H6658_02145 [Ardenticatenaceae bacterium]|nr:hypothetical protein [Ardenticatenaceae bacterium]
MEARPGEDVSQEEETAREAAYAVVWIPIRRGGKLLFEYDPHRLRVRVKVRGLAEPVVIDLMGVGNGH